MNLTKYLFILSIIFTSFQVKAQQSPNEDQKKNFFVVEQGPLFAGCESLRKAEQKSCSDKNLMEYIRENLEYPEEARLDSIEGKVITQFIVDLDGSITEINVLKGIGHGCDEAAVELLENMPKWTPAKQRKKPVWIYFTLPITFEL